MKGLPFYFVFLLALFVFPFVNAQNPIIIKKWSMEDCLKYALDHNYALNSLKLKEETSFQDLKLAKGYQLPSLSASLDNNFFNAKNISSSNGTIVNQFSSSSSSSSGSYLLNTSLTVWNANYIKNSIHQKDLIHESNAYSIQELVNSNSILIVHYYLAILLVKEINTYITDLVQASESKVKQGRYLYELGSIPKKNLLELEAQLASDKYLLVENQNSIRQNTLNLKQLLQIASDSLFDIRVPQSIVINEVIPTFPSVLEHALARFPDIKIGQLGIEIATLDISKARAGFQPVLSVSGNLSTGYHSYYGHPTLTTDSFFNQIDQNFEQMVGIRLLIPIFSNRVNQTNLEKALIGYRQASLDSKNSRLLLSQQVEQAFLNSINALESYKAAAEQLKAATETNRIVNEQFRLGSLNSFDLIVERNQYIQAFQTFTQSKYSALLEEKIYEFFMGKPLFLNY